MSVNREETLKQFCDVTGADESRSRFFLESSNWMLEVALSSFYEHGGNIDEGPGNASTVPQPVPVLSDSDMESPPGSPVTQKKDKKPKRPSSQKFATLSTLQQDNSSSDEEEVSNWAQTFFVQDLFCNEASCSKHSEDNVELCYLNNKKITELNKKIEELKEAMQKLLIENRELKKQIANLSDKTYKEDSSIESQNVRNVELNKQVSLKIKDSDTGLHKSNQTESMKIDSSTNLRNQKDNVNLQIVEARDENDTGQAFYAGGSDRSGQQIIGPGKAKNDVVTEMFKSVRARGAVVFEDEPTTTSRGTFSGTGYRLGATPDDHVQVGAATPAQAQDSSEPRFVRIRMYREGFTVDNGALQPYSDPDNAEFLTYIKRGQIPPSLRAETGEVRVSLEDHRHEDCPRVSRGAAFTGKGHLLGSPTPPTVGATAAVAAAEVDRAANLRAAQHALGLDEGSPVTSIQFRLADGSRLTGRFNHTHTVGDLRRYLSLAAPACQLQDFSLMTAFPRAELGDTAATLAQANLLNSVVVQRLL